MSKAEILQGLSTLDPSELQEVRDRVLQLEEQELLGGRVQPTEYEKEILDRELEDYRRSPNAGFSWEEVEARLK